MKRAITVLLLVAGLIAYGQDDDRELTTIFSGDHASGGYGAPELRLGNINNTSSLFVGGRGGWIIGHQFVLGGAGYGLATNNTFDHTENLLDGNDNMVNDSIRSLKIGMGYGGVLIEYILMPQKPVHFSFPLIIGAGGANVGSNINNQTTNGTSQNWTSYESVESSSFFIVEPGVNVELNLTKFMRLSCGANYRLVTGTNLLRLNDSDFSGLAFNFALKFGVF